MDRRLGFQNCSGNSPPSQTIRLTTPNLIFSLWSALCHQGDVYSASYAAVPFIVRMIEGNAEKANWHPLALIAAIEIGRAKGNGPPLRPDLAQPYHDALRNVPKMLASLAFREWDELFCRAAAALLAAAKGQPDLADRLLDHEKSDF